MEDNPLFRKKALDKLRSPEQLNQLLTVTSPRAWLVLTPITILLVLAVAWSLVGTIQAGVSGRGALVPNDQEPATLDAVIYVPVEEGRHLMPGMTARISPATIKPEQYGSLWGQVVAVGATPATQADMTEVLHNDALAQSLVLAGQLLEVRIRLLRDVNTPTGYRWTLAQGAPLPLQAGVFCAGNVIVSQQHPIELVFPGLRLAY